MNHQPGKKKESKTKRIVIENSYSEEENKFSVHLSWAQLSPWGEKQKQVSNYPWYSFYISNGLTEDTFRDGIEHPNIL